MVSPVHAGWQGPHPINKLHGVVSIVADYYRPLFTSFPDLQRQDDLFFAGRWRDADWVCATGHYSRHFLRRLVGHSSDPKDHAGAFRRVLQGR